MKTRNLFPVENRSSGHLSLAPDARSPGPIAIPLPEDRAAAQRRRGRPKRVRWAALLMLLVLGGGGVYWFLVPPAIGVVHPRRGPAVQAVYATGTVEPTVMVPISAHGMARLVELNADEGSIVNKAQVLARLEDDDLRRAIDMAAAEERYAKAALDRQSALVERQVAARSAYDRARADWEKASATTAKAAAEARFLELTAPADGTVIRRDGEIGQLIGANQTVFWLSCCAPLRISAEVDEEDIAQVHHGQRVLIRSDSFPGRSFEGQVQAVTPKGDPVARSYRVRITLPADTPLMIGMTTETNIVLRQNQSALLLPAGAVQQDTVWRVKDGRLAPSKIKVGARGAREVEIIDGVGEGDWIVAAPSPGLKAGGRVRAAENTAPR